VSDLPGMSGVMRQYGFVANKRLGQHFLFDQNITDKIVLYARPLDGVSVAEIGPGPGGLTRSLLQAETEQVLAIEMDERFLPPLGDIARAYPNRLILHHGDAVKVDISKRLTAPIKIIANLPYNVSTQLLTGWLTAKPLFWSQAVLMFQKEVADRITAGPGDKSYGRLAVLAQSVCICRQAFDIPARAFTPPPKVDSTVIVLNPLPERERFKALDKLGEVTQAAFGQRRKMLRRSLKSIALKYELDLDIWLSETQINPAVRPESLNVLHFRHLAKGLSN